MQQAIPSKVAVEIPLPPDDEVRALLGPTYNPDTALNVFKMFAGTQDMFPAVIGFIRAVFTAEGIDPKARAIIVLRAATLYKARYEWEANAKFAENLGVTQDEIRAIAQERPVTHLDAAYVLVCAATDELSLGGALTDETLRRLLAHFGDTATRKVILIIGWFNLLSIFVNGCRVPLETADKIGAKRSPLE
jgi:alkylhydroperoxidase family enzyme